MFYKFAFYFFFSINFLNKKIDLLFVKFLNNKQPKKWPTK